MVRSFAIVVPATLILYPTLPEYCYRGRSPSIQQARSPTTMGSPTSGYEMCDTTVSSSMLVYRPRSVINRFPNSFVLEAVRLGPGDEVVRQFVRRSNTNVLYCDKVSYQWPNSPMSRSQARGH
jgi:hypothetical protein